MVIWSTFLVGSFAALAIPAFDGKPPPANDTSAYMALIVFGTLWTKLYLRRAGWLKSFGIALAVTFAIAGTLGAIRGVNYQPESDNSTITR
jgi:hypothetical protein